MKLIDTPNGNGATTEKPAAGEGVGLGFDISQLAGFVPARGKVLVKADPPETQTKTGLIIPEMARKNRSTGMVLLAPAGCPYPQGTRVLFTIYGGELADFLGEGDLKLLTYWPEEDTEILGSWPVDTPPVSV